MKLLKSTIKYLLITIVVIAALNIPLTTRYGVDGVLYVKKIPLYAKACGFLYRDWAYRDIVKDIVKDEKDETRKALSILEWTNSNVISGVPKGLKVVDDHPLNIIIRQFGAGDQVEDVFTILCSYAGLKAGMERCYEPGTEDFIVLSFVKAGGRWLVFDAKHGKYFLNVDKAVASVSDILSNRAILSEKDKALYSKFFVGLKDVNTSLFTRAEEQMPLKRIPAKIKKILQK